MTPLSERARDAMTLFMGTGRGWSDRTLDRLVTDALAAVPDGETLPISALLDLGAECVAFVETAEHDAGCSGTFPPHRCKCGLTDLRDRLAGES